MPTLNMKFFALGLSIFLVILGAYASRKYQVSSRAPAKKEVLSESKEEDKEDKIETATITPNPTSSPAPTTAPTSTDKSLITNFVYPGAAVKSQTSSTLTLESTDHTDKITDWYKSKIESLGVNVKSFVATRANDKVLNKLAGAGKGLEINVEISKDAGSFLATISVNFN